jgi:NAD dependent epimerase/dehydratase
MSYTGTRVLVTGADGFIGSHLVEELVRMGADVTALSFYNSFDSYGWLDELDESTISAVRRVRGDIRDAAFVRHLVDGCDIVFHLAALIAIPHSYVSPHAYVETNVVGTLNVLEAARACGVRRVVHTSTSEVYGTATTLPIAEGHPLQAQSPYSASKIGADMLAESFVRSFEIPVAILRPFNTYGPRQSERAVIGTVIRQALDPSCQIIHVGDITTVRDFNFVSDTVSAFLAVGISPCIRFGRPYNAGSGNAVPIADMIEMVFGIIGCEKSVEEDAERLRPHDSEVLALLADSTRLTAETGWRPGVDLREGLARTIAWWRMRLLSGRVRPTAEFMT